MYLKLYIKMLSKGEGHGKNRRGGRYIINSVEIIYENNSKRTETEIEEHEYPLWRLMELKKALSEIESRDEERFAAIQNYYGIANIDHCLDACKTINSHLFIPKVYNDCDLGLYVCGLYSDNELGVFGEYIDHEKLGFDVRFDQGGCYIEDYGYIATM